MRDKQHLAAVRPLDGALAMSTMRFADEVVPRSDIEGLPPTRQGRPEGAADGEADLIEGLSTEWDPKQYHDTYTEALRKRITAKNAGKEVVETTDEEPEGRVLDLMAALEASVDAAKKRPRTAKGDAESRHGRPAKKSHRASTSGVTSRQRRSG